jgi:hypothetical protein
VSVVGVVTLVVAGAYLFANALASFFVAMFSAIGALATVAALVLTVAAVLLMTVVLETPPQLILLHPLAGWIVAGLTALASACGY